VTLRARLTLFFVGIVVVPLVVAAFGLRALVESEVERRTNTRLETSARGVAAVWAERLELVQLEVARAAGRVVDALAEGRPLRPARARAGTGLDFLLITEGEKGVVESSLDPADFLPGVSPPSPEALAAGEAPSLTARVEVVSAGKRLEVVGGIYADAGLAESLQRAGGVDVAVVSGGRTVAATLNDRPVPTAEPGEPASLPDGRATLLVPFSGGADQGVLLVAENEGGDPSPLGWAILAMGVLVAVILGSFLARMLARPLERLAEGAREVSAGNLDLRLERGQGEADVARVADAFNTITTSLQQYVDELRDSRDELRRGLERLGATLRSTHDLDAMLGVVLDSAATTLGARSGAVFLLSGRAYRMEVAKAFHPGEKAELTVGQGVAGRAALGQPVLFPGEPDVAPDMDVEPVSNTAVAVPLNRGDRIIGVLALYHRMVPEPFDREDAKTLASFATQASVAIENVLLHREAQRLSITDGLTGVWNRRYLQLTLAKEIDRSQRFGRPLSVLMIDIDDFKLVNDRFGHPRGDEVLVELTRRALGQIRTQIDFLTRYGGEEFVVVLPETPAEGAMVVAQKIRQAIGEEPFLSEGGPQVEVTVSIGASTFPEDGSSMQELVEAADQAMYRAKEGGRDRVEAAWAQEG
jgi:two-component system cell cycle response regulator